MLVTTEVEILKVAVVDPAGTVTVEGSDATELLEVKLTAVPPVGAAEPNVTVPVADDPPVTELGETDNFESKDGLMVRVADPLPAGTDAFIVDVEVAVTADVETVNVVAD